MASKKAASETPANTIDSFDSPDSKLILGAIYDHSTQQLRVTFRHTGFTYCYEGITPELWADFAMAASKGGFFGKMIRPMYAGKKVGG